MSGLMKLAFVAGKAPAEFASMASKLYPIVVKTALMKPFGFTANQFIMLLGVFELIAAVALFYRPQVAAMMTTAVMLGAEYVAFSEGENSSMPASPMCGNKAVCMQSHIFHAILVLMSVVVYKYNTPLCSAWVKAWQAVRPSSSKRRAGSSTPEATTPSRPRRAAAMKKKD